MNSLCALISCLSFLPFSFFLVHTFPNPGTLGKQIKASPGGFYKLHEAHGRTPGMKHWAQFMTGSEAQIESVKWRGLLGMACSSFSAEWTRRNLCQWFFQYFGSHSLKVLCIDGAKCAAQSSGLTAPSSGEDETLVLVRIRTHCTSAKVCLCPATNTANLQLHLPAVKYP